MLVLTSVTTVRGSSSGSGEKGRDDMLWGAGMARGTPTWTVDVGREGGWVFTSARCARPGHGLGCRLGKRVDGNLTTGPHGNHVNRGFTLNLVVLQGIRIVERLARKHKSLSVRRDPLVVLDLSLDVGHGVGRLHLEREGAPGHVLDKDCKRSHCLRIEGEKNTHA